jgi:hypothetical protein
MPINVWLKLAMREISIPHICALVTMGRSYLRDLMAGMSIIQKNKNMIIEIFQKKYPQKNILKMIAMEKYLKTLPSHA